MDMLALSQQAQAAPESVLGAKDGMVEEHLRKCQKKR
jgi:hypothetical protein